MDAPKPWTKKEEDRYFYLLHETKRLGTLISRSQKKRQKLEQELLGMLYRPVAS